MSRVAIITDTTVNLPESYVQEFSLTVLPQVLIWDEETFEDGIDISPSAFYQRLKTDKSMPSTSQVTPQRFLKAYRELLNQDYQILAILIGENLSGTIASALQAKESFPEAPIEIVDSGTTSLAMGFVVLVVAEALKSGADFKEAKALAERAKEKVGVVFAVETLEFLHRGGRIGGGSRFLGTALNIKPILEVTGGRVEAVERVRTRTKSLSRLVELAEERIAGRTPVRLGGLHAAAPDDALAMLNLASSRIESVQTVFTEVSPVIGNHAGPGTVGLAWIAGL